MRPSAQDAKREKCGSGNVCPGLSPCCCQHDKYHSLNFSKEAFSRPLLLVERCQSIFLCPDILEVLSNAWPAGDALLDVRPMDENAANAGQMHL